MTKGQLSSGRVIKKRNFKNFNEQAFLYDLSHADLERIGLIPDPELAFEYFSSLFNSLVDKHTPYKNFRIKNRSNPWFTADLSEALRSRDLAWTKARFSNNPLDWLNFRKQRNKCIRLIRTAKSNYYLSSLSTSRDNATRFWEALKSLKSSSCASLPAQISSGNTYITNKLDICDAFNHHFIAAGHIFDNNAAATDSTSGHEAATAPNFPLHSRTAMLKSVSFSLRPVIHTEVLHALNCLDLKKSKGEDGLDPFLLHMSAHLIASPLAHIFNLSFSSSKIPTVWKAVQVTPLFKGGNPNILDNCRPISKLCCLAKVLESLVNSQLRTFLESNSILQPQQSGFRPGHSTTIATTLVVNNIISGLDAHQHCAALFIDLSKAFDTVDHNILLNELSSSGLDSLSVSWFSNYLSGRSQVVIADGVRSKSLLLHKGVPQGSILGPLLFSLYINIIMLPSLASNVHYYADDTILHSIAPTLNSAVMNLLAAFNHFQSSLIAHKLVLNSSMPLPER